MDFRSLLLKEREGREYKRGKGRKEVDKEWQGMKKKERGIGDYF